MVSTSTAMLLPRLVSASAAFTRATFVANPATSARALIVTVARALLVITPNWQVTMPADCEQLPRVVETDT